MLVASGDSGVGTTCKSGTAKTFTTSFPASCPWVTVVGGTTGNSPENAWSGSGGGFSSVFGRPSYQDSAVNSWLTNDKTHAGVSQYFNSSGRAYPDVAAQSTNFVIIASGSSELVSGTSAATPTFASIIQLLNSNRIAAGKAALGFLNPWLYSTATAGLTDIKSGKNTGCSGVISGAGFSAVSVSHLSIGFAHRFRILIPPSYRDGILLLVLALQILDFCQRFPNRLSFKQSSPSNRTKVLRSTRSSEALKVCRDSEEMLSVESSRTIRVFHLVTCAWTLQTDLNT